MLATTIEIIRCGLRADPSLTPSERIRLLALVRQGLYAQDPQSTAGNSARIIRRAEAARRLSCSLRLIDRLARDGILTKRKLPGRMRASGFLEQDLNALIVGRARQ